MSLYDHKAELGAWPQAITNPYDNNGRPSPAFWSTNGQITDAGSPRTIQLGLKYIF